MKKRWMIFPLLALSFSCAPFAGAAPATKPKPKTAAKKTVSKAKPKTVAKKPLSKPQPRPKPRVWATPLPVKTPAARTPIEKTPVVETPAEATPSFQTWALLIGISKYAAPQVTSLNFPAADATGIRDALIDKKLGNIPAGHVKLLTDADATGANILGAVDSFLKPNVKAGDHVIVFLAGHGVAKGVGANAKSYLLPTDVRGLSTAALDSSAVDLRVLANKLATLPAAQFVQFVDACREDPTPGRAGKSNALTDVMSRGVHVEPQDDKASSVTFFACGIGQRAFEDPELHHGVFTYWILDGIKKANVPQAPSGAIDMGRLVTFVSDKVGDWAKQASNNGDFEIAQTPEMLASQPATDSDPVILMRVRRPLSDSPIKPAAPQLSVITFPEGARVSIDGQNAGTAPLTRVLASGAHKVRIEAIGYEPAEREIRLIDGYPQQVVFELKPQGRGLSGAGADATNASFAQALDAETRQMWEVAEAGYRATISADVKFAPAYERLADLQSRQGRNLDSLNTLLTMGSQAPANAHAYSLLANAFSAFALHGAGEGNTDNRRLAVGPFKTPSTPQAAADYARTAANAAIKADAASAETNRALGFALIATDKKGANKNAALAAFGKAAFSNDKDATNFYALGYGLRFFAAQNGTIDKDELQRALSNLNQAIVLRPDYYEAHRELAYCHHLLGDEDAAIREYDLANANRGAARDKNEVAGNSVALSSLHQEKANNSSGEEKQRETEASTADLDEARETSGGNLKLAVGVLSVVGLSTQIRDYLPPEVTRIMDLPKNIEGDVKNKVRDKIKLPGGGRLPF